MIIHSDAAPTFTLGGTTATGYASPSRGARDLSLWRIALAPGEASPPHALTREEVFLALDGTATATLDGAEHPFAAGDCLVVPAGVPFTLTAGPQGLQAVCAMPGDGQATILPDGPTMTPPWAV
jgi:mannose-6-phosphate isomerase-like protein (cupin superfamily)